MKKNILLQLTFVDEVGSQLEGLELGPGHVTGNGTEVHVSGSTGRQLAPGLLYIDDKKQNPTKVSWILNSVREALKKKEIGRAITLG